jgi:hypothetical protein
MSGAKAPLKIVSGAVWPEDTVRLAELAQPVPRVRPPHGDRTADAAAADDWDPAHPKLARLTLVQ